DIIDTAAMLQVRDAFDVIRGDLLAAGAACAELCERHRRTPIAGRTLLQQAVPTTFGTKAAQWLAGITRQLDRLRQLRDSAIVLQFGGASGTLASLGPHGLAVSEHLADGLGLGLPDLPWHTERSRVAEIAAAAGITGGVAAKIATDVVLLAQSEVGEVHEAGGADKGRSSTMPHK
ncbi:MAG: 3-carboxy-cis,cis-muconate cycloisomerase, partial [Kiloniellaceae bacterium]|nr:3-carboxy-cis,cis-muconate cycloisomerase [Kiloniellaceae bacterium]